MTTMSKGFVVAALLVIVGATSCACRSVSANLTGLPLGYGRLIGHVGPGAPPDGFVPDMTLTFSNGSQQFRASVMNHQFKVDLPAGTWSVKSADGDVCATNIPVRAGDIQSDDLGYPMAQCQDLGGPPGPTSQPPAT